MFKALLLIILLNVNFVFSESSNTEVMKNLEELQSVLDNSLFLKKNPWKVLGFKEKPDDMKFIMRLEKLLRVSNPEYWIKVQEELSSKQVLGQILINSYKVLRNIKDNYRNRSNIGIDSFLNLNMSFEQEDKIIITLEDDIAKYFVEYDLSKNSLIAYPRAHGLIGMVPFETTKRYNGLLKLLELENFGGIDDYINIYIEELEKYLSSMREKDVVDMSDEKFSLINERTEKIILYFNDLWPKADKRIYFYTSSDTYEDIPERPKIFKEILYNSFPTDKCRELFNKFF